MGRPKAVFVATRRANLQTDNGEGSEPFSTSVELRFEPGTWAGDEPVSGGFTDTGVDDMDFLEIDLDGHVVLAMAELD